MFSKSKKIIATTLAATMIAGGSMVAFATQANAADNNAGYNFTSPTVASPHAVQAIRDWSGQGFAIHDYYNLNDSAQNAFNIAKGNTQQVAAVQTAIKSNPALTKALMKKNVEINNIVAAKSSMTGGVTFYTM